MALRGHNTVTTRSLRGHNTRSQHGHNTVTTRSQRGHYAVTTRSLRGHNTRSQHAVTTRGHNAVTTKEDEAIAGGDGMGSEPLESMNAEIKDSPAVEDVKADGEKDALEAEASELVAAIKDQGVSVMESGKVEGEKNVPDTEGSDKGSARVEDVLPASVAEDVEKDSAPVEVETSEHVEAKDKNVSALKAGPKAAKARDAAKDAKKRAEKPVVASFTSTLDLWTRSVLSQRVHKEPENSSA